MNDPNQQILSQMEQLNYQLSLNRESNVRDPDRLEMVMNVGYFFGLIGALVRKVTSKSLSDCEAKQRAINTITQGISNPQSDNELFEFGFAIGFMQTVFEEHRSKWWDPVVYYIRIENWSAVTRITQRNSRLSFIYEEEHWDKLLDHARKIILELGYELLSQEQLDQISKS